MVTALPSPCFVHLLVASLAAVGRAADASDGRFSGLSVVSSVVVWVVTGRGEVDVSWSILMYSDRVLPILITYKQRASREAVAVTSATSRR